MRNQGILVAVLVGLAGPAPSALAEDRETTGRVSYKDTEAGDPPPRAAAPRDDRWIELADPTPTQHGKVYITVGASAGPFSRLRIDASKGRPRVNTVRVDFKHGPSRVFKVRTRLDRKRKPSVQVDLHGAREIRQIVVHGDPRSGGTYTVHGDTTPPAEEAKITRIR